MSKDKQAEQDVLEAIRAAGVYVSGQIGGILSLAEAIYDLQVLIASESEDEEASEYDSSIAKDPYEDLRKAAHSSEIYSERHKMGEEFARVVARLPGGFAIYCHVTTRVFDNLIDYLDDAVSNDETTIRLFKDTSFVKDFEALQVILDTAGKWLYHEMSCELDDGITSNPLKSGDYIGVRSAARRLHTLRRRVQAAGSSQLPTCLEAPLGLAEYIVETLRGRYNKKLTSLKEEEGDEESGSIFKSSANDAPTKKDEPSLDDKINDLFN